jgi:hypothetical protein
MSYHPRFSSLSRWRQTAHPGLLLSLFGDTAVGIDVRDFTHGNHLTVFLIDQF